ncbi:hypothetical protein B0H13DRAFT_2683902 [Mycena leptocephala]|nr:hypothetical protein B0H13DRAFT_2683902 [Mycena leptocephala]
MPALSSSPRSSGDVPCEDTGWVGRAGESDEGTSFLPLIPDLRLRPFPRPCSHPASSPRFTSPSPSPCPFDLLIAFPIYLIYLAFRIIPLPVPHPYPNARSLSSVISGSSDGSASFLKPVFCCVPPSFSLSPVFRTIAYVMRFTDIFHTPATNSLLSTADSAVGT